MPSPSLHLSRADAHLSAARDALHANHHSPTVLVAVVIAVSLAILVGPAVIRLLGRAPRSTAALQASFTAPTIAALHGSAASAAGVTRQAA